MTPARLPLDGLRVIDLGTVIAAPGAARYLADFGAGPRRPTPLRRSDPAPEPDADDR